MAHHHHHHHVHNHDHHHSPAVMQFDKAFAISVALNLAFTVTETVYALIANSMGLLADAAHNLGDVLGLLMAWAASWMLRRNATERYSYGYKKLTILAALGNALILVLTSALIVYESISKLLHPIAVQEHIVIIVALIGIFINGGTALLFMKGKNDDLNIKGAYLHLLYDALISVGVVVSGIVIYLTGWIRLDPIVGLLIVIAILMGTWGLLRNSVDLILGAVPHGIDQQKVRTYLEKIPGVVAVHDLHIWGLSTQENALTAHLVMPDGGLADADVVRINQDLKCHFQIHHVTLQVEKGQVEDPCGQTKIC